MDFFLISIDGPARSRSEGVYMRGGGTQSLDGKGLSDELLAELPQLGPVISVHDVRRQLILGRGILVQKGTVGLLDGGINHGRDERRRALRCACEVWHVIGAAVEIAQCCFQSTIGQERRTKTREHGLRSVDLRIT